MFVLVIVVIVYGCEIYLYIYYILLYMCTIYMYICYSYAYVHTNSYICLAFYLNALFDVKCDWFLIFTLCFKVLFVFFNFSMPFPQYTCTSRHTHTHTFNHVLHYAILNVYKIYIYKLNQIIVEILNDRLRTIFATHFQYFVAVIQKTFSITM